MNTHNKIPYFKLIATDYLFNANDVRFKIVKKFELLITFCCNGSNALQNSNDKPVIVGKTNSCTKISLKLFSILKTKRKKLTLKTFFFGSTHVSACEMTPQFFKK